MSASPREVVGAALVVARRPAAAARLPAHLVEPVRACLAEGELDVREPWPSAASLARLHPSWLAAASGGEPPQVARVLAGEAGASWAQALVLRAGTSHLVPMPARGPAAAASEALLAALEALGARRLALALASVPAAAQAQVLAALEAASSAAVRAALPAALAAPAAARGLAVREVGDLVRDRDARWLALRAAARHLGPALAQAGELGPQLAQRLPRELGLAFLAELARGSAPLADSAAALEALADATHEPGDLGDAERP